MNLKPPKDSNFKEDLDGKKNIWEQLYDFYLLANGVTKKMSEYKLSHSNVYLK